MALVWESMNLKEISHEINHKKRTQDDNFTYTQNDAEFWYWQIQPDKVHIFSEGHKILRNPHLNFVLCSASQK